MNEHGFWKDSSSERKEMDKDPVHQTPYVQRNNRSTASPLLLKLQDSLGLRASRNPRPLQTLLLDLFSETWQVRVEALHGLELQNEAVPPRALLTALEDKNAFVRAAAARAIGSIGAIELKDQLLNALHDADKHVRAAAIQALGNLPIKNEKKVFIEHFSDPEGIVRAAAIAAAGKQSDITLLPFLQQVLGEETDEIARMEADDAYQRLKASCPASSSALEGCFMDIEDSQTIEDDPAQKETLKIKVVSRPTRESEIAPSRNMSMPRASTSHWCPYCSSFPGKISSWINQLDTYGSECSLEGPEPLDDPALIDALVRSLYKVFENRRRVFMSQSSIEHDTAVVLSNSYTDETDVADEHFSIEEIVRRAIKNTISVAPLCTALNETDKAVRRVAEGVQKELDNQPWTEVLLIAGEMLPPVGQRRLNPGFASKKVIFCSISYSVTKQDVGRIIDAPILNELIDVHHQGEEQGSNYRFSPRLSRVKIWYGVPRSFEMRTNMIGVK